MDKEFDIVLAGPISLDVIRVGDKVETVLGGGVWYAAFPLLALGLKVALVTRLAREDYSRLKPAEDAGATLFPVEAFETTSIENMYFDETMETRTCTVLGCSSAMLPEDLPDVKTEVYYGGALMRGEVPLETLRFMKSRAAVSVDLQGYLRYRDGNSMLTGPFEALPELLSLTDYLKADLAEAEVSTGSDQPETAARIFASQGPREVIVTGLGKVTALVDGVVYQESLTPRSMVGRTGRGDTCMSTWVGARLAGSSPRDALKLTAMVTSRKMEIPGPYLGSVTLVDTLPGA